jgi:hypothetical protein
MTAKLFRLLCPYSAFSKTESQAQKIGNGAGLASLPRQKLKNIFHKCDRSSYYICVKRLKSVNGLLV